MSSIIRILAGLMILGVIVESHQPNYTELYFDYQDDQEAHNELEELDTTTPPTFNIKMVVDNHEANFDDPSNMFNTVPPPTIYLYRKNSLIHLLIGKPIPQRPSVLIVHGIEKRYTDDAIEYIRDAFFTHNDLNVFLLFWFGIENAYKFQTVNRYKILGYNLAKSVNSFFTEAKIPLTDLHVVGFGQDAYISSAMIKYLNEMNQATIDRVTALNPTTPDLDKVNAEGFNIKNIHANYTEVYHTEVTEYGTMDSQGDVDIYFNGGKAQPGCDHTDHRCSHERAWIYYCEMIQDPNKVIAKKCTGQNDKKCETHNINIDARSKLLHGTYFTQSKSSSTTTD